MSISSIDSPLSCCSTFRIELPNQGLNTNNKMTPIQTERSVNKMEEYIGECQSMYCEKEATTKGFILLRPDNEGDAPNFQPALVCDAHSKERGFFLYATQDEIDRKKEIYGE